MISQRERGELARFYTVTDPKKHQKGYTVYKVTARIISRKSPEDVQEITVWKRYSDFRKLHQDLCQIHQNLYSQSELFPPFAKAKLFGRFDDSVIEERRQCSEDLLQFSANIPALYSSQHIQDFFKGGEVHDGSELIGPAEPFSDFLTDSLSDCSFDVQKDIAGDDDLTAAGQSDYGIPTSDSELISLPTDADSLAELDDGMASSGSPSDQPPGWGSPPAQPHRGREGASPAREPEVSRASRAALFPAGLRRKDYRYKAMEQIRLAEQKEAEQDYCTALSFYRSGVDLLLQGVQGEASPTRREAVKRQTAEYLMRAEHISSLHLREVKGQGSPQAVCSRSSWSLQSPLEELKAYRVLGIIDKVLLVMDKRTQETFILKVLRKSSECGRTRQTIMPHCVPNMVRLRKFIVSEDSVFLLLQYAEGGKLWSHIGKFLHPHTPEDSFDIPFIQKSHTTALRSPEHAAPELSLHGEEAAPSSLPRKSRLLGQGDPIPDSGATSEEECTNSYLTLCNEYEQEKEEDEEEEREGEEDEGAVVMEERGGLLVASCTVASSRPHSLLCSPISPGELRFFTEMEEMVDQEWDQGFSPLLSLDRSKRTPMEFFRIDSKDSVGEVACPEPHKIRPKSFNPSQLLPSASDLGADLWEVKGHGPDLWQSDSDRESNESVPVISFKEAVVEEEARPPDLLVNLPEVGGGALVAMEELASVGVSLAVEATPSPKFRKPDVLQLHHDPAEDGVEAELAVGHTHVIPGSSLLADGPQEEDATDPSAFSASVGHAHKVSARLADVIDVSRGSASLELGRDPGVEEQDRDTYRLFGHLDEPSQARLPEEFVRSWAAEIVVALVTLHREGIICRDLNPNNLLLNDKGHVQLTYFCSCNEVEDSYDREAVAKMYCAPEMGGICEETEACDWWSLGAILFELLTGKSLYQCHSVGISRHTTLNVPEYVSEEARSLLQQLLQFNPAERLGAGVAGVDDIKSHPFFAHVEWPK